MISVLETSTARYPKRAKIRGMVYLQAHGRNRLRHHEKAGLNRREAEANLIQEGKEKWNAANAKPREKAAAHGRAERANPKQDEIQHRMGGPGRVKSVPRQQRDGKREKPQNLAHAQRMFAKYLQHIGQQRNTGPEQDQSRHIEGVGAFAVIRQVQVDQQQAGQTNRNIHEENEPPVKVSDDEAARDRSEHRTD
jgi:hypothetical protein